MLGQQLVKKDVNPAKAFAGLTTGFQRERA
jgi:hypothetical protein